MKAVRICGTAGNLVNMHPPQCGEETWCANNYKGYNQQLSRIIAQSEWTRWFNMHSHQHITKTYPRCYAWYQKQDGSRPIYLQHIDPTIPASVAFPREHIQDYFKTSDSPQRYFTFSGSWFLALAMYEHFERIELCGYEIKSTKPAYAFERPCCFYWIARARHAGIDVVLPPELGWSEPGDPNSYTGPLYGYETT